MNKKLVGKVNSQQIPLPGQSLEKQLVDQGLSQIDLAKRTGLTPKTINGIIKGIAPISPDTAVALERVLGVSAKHWLSLEADYQIHKINSSFVESMEDDEVLFLKKIDLKGLIKKKWVKKYDSNLDQIKAVLKFLGVGSTKQLSQVWSDLDVNYKTSQAYNKNYANIMLWLRKGELLANEIPCKPYDAKKFKVALQECRKLTKLSFSEANSKIQDLCAEAGVAVTFVPCLANVSTSGAAKWLSKDKASIQLSLKGKRDDIFWFSFYHEAAHILLHGRKDQFIDASHAPATFYSPVRQLIEAEADDFASNILVPKKMLLEFLDAADFTKRSIKKFAKEIDIAPGIIVGQLQNRKVIGWGSELTKLKKEYEFDIKKPD